MHTRVHLRLQGFITCEPDIIWKRDFHQSASLAEATKTLEAHGCELSVANQLIYRTPYIRYTNCKCHLLHYSIGIIISLPIKLQISTTGDEYDIMRLNVHELQKIHL